MLKNLSSILFLSFLVSCAGFNPPVEPPVPVPPTPTPVPSKCSDVQPFNYDSWNCHIGKPLGSHVRELNNAIQVVKSNNPEWFDADIIHGCESDGSEEGERLGEPFRARFFDAVSAEMNKGLICSFRFEQKDEIITLYLERKALQAWHLIFYGPCRILYPVNDARLPYKNTCIIP